MIYEVTVLIPRKLQFEARNMKDAERTMRNILKTRYSITPHIPLSLIRVDAQDGQKSAPLKEPPDGDRT